MDKKQVQTVKMHLIYQEQPEMDYKNFKRVMFEIQDNIRGYKNHGSSLYFTHLTSDMEFQRENGRWPTKEESGMDGGAYWFSKELRHSLFADDLAVLNSGCTDSIGVSLQKFLTARRKDYIAGRATVPDFKTNQPIEFRRQEIQLYEKDGDCFIRLSVFSNSGKRQFGLKSGQIDFKVFPKDKSGVSVVRNCVAGTFQHAAGQMKYDKSKEMFEFSLCFKFDKAVRELDQNNVLGIDLGINLPFVAVANENGKVLKAPYREIEQFRAGIENRRYDMQRSCIYAAQGSVGHGRETRLKPLDKIGDKVARFRDTKNHAYSRQIVDFAVKNNCGTIQMEDLSGVSDNRDKRKRKYLKAWSYYDLQNKIRYKAEAEGIRVVMIDPHYTSQRCHHCGCISKENRDVEKNGQSYFHCVVCGHEENADINAARNIAMPDIENIIKEQCEVQANTKTA